MSGFQPDVFLKLVAAVVLAAVSVWLIVTSLR